MRRLLLLVSALLVLVSSSCPSSFSLQFNGICTYFAQNGGSHQYNNLHSDADVLCNTKDGIPTIIRNQEEQDYWVGIARKYSYSLALGLGCNKTNSKWEWDDGSAVTYSPPNGAAPTGSCSQTTSWYLLNTGAWASSSSTSATSFIIYCMKELSSVSMDDECGDFARDSEDDICYQVGVHAESWVDAQTVCKSVGANVASVHNSQENSFLRRLAVSKGLVNGIMLGASITGKSTNYSWLDGTPWDYTNFMPGFPMDGEGDCVAMDTNNVGGLWLNMQCSSQMQYACVKRPGDEEPGCGDTVRTEGEIIYSPGFPRNASVPCDFFLKVDPGKLVEVTVLFLEANSCCDRLILTEGTLGGSVIAKQAK